MVVNKHTGDRREFGDGGAVAGRPPLHLGAGRAGYGTFYPHGSAWPPTPDSSLFSTDEAAFEDNELTQAEREEYQRGLVTWEMAKSWRFWLRWRWVPWYLLLGAAMCVLAALSIYHREVSPTARLLTPRAPRCHGASHGSAKPRRQDAFWFAGDHRRRSTAAAG